RPRILLADEPTGNLDADTGGEIVRLLRDLNRCDGLTIIMVTHNLDIVCETDRVVRLAAGRVETPSESAPLARVPAALPRGEADEEFPLPFGPVSGWGRDSQ